MERMEDPVCSTRATAVDVGLGVIFNMRNGELPEQRQSRKSANAGGTVHNVALIFGA